MHKSIVILIAVCMAISSSYAQTPVGTLVAKYGNIKGAQDFSAKGSKLNLIRGIIRKSPVAPIADDIEELVILKLTKASSQHKMSFQSDLRSALGGYEYCGMETYGDETFEIYVLRSGNDTVEDLVIYNPAIYSLNSLRGSIPVSSLESLATGQRR